LGVPIVYVIRHQLIPESNDEDPPFGEQDTNYTSIEQETIARAPIMTYNADYSQDYNAEIFRDPYSKKSQLPSIGNFPYLAESRKLSSYRVLGQSRIQQRHITRYNYNHSRIEAQ
jgi:hypothetical protein